MESHMNRERMEYLDILKGIGILFVVWGHMGIVPDYIVTYWQSFFMSLFFIVSGYLWRTRNLSVYFKKRMFSLFVP